MDYEGPIPSLIEARQLVLDHYLDHCPINFVNRNDHYECSLRFKIQTVCVSSVQPYDQYDLLGHLLHSTHAYHKKIGEEGY